MYGGGVVETAAGEKREKKVGGTMGEALISVA